MENKYLNLTGAIYIISKIKTLLRDKSDKGHISIINPRNNQNY